MSKFVCAAVAAVLVLGGCEAGLRGGPKDGLKASRNFNEIIVNGTLSEKRLAFLATQRSVDFRTRNTIIEARMAEIDVAYFQYESRISAEIRSGNFATSVAGILIGAAGGQSSGAAAANYAALGGVLSGATAAYQKEVLLNQSLQAFISQMRANRNRKKTEIIGKLAEKGDVYTLQSALSDLAEYYQAGTLASAIAGLTEKAQQAEKSSRTGLQAKEVSARQNRATNASTDGITETSLDSILIFIGQGRTNDEVDARESRVQKCFDDATAPNKPAELGDYFVSGGGIEPLGAQIKTCLGLT